MPVLLTSTWNRKEWCGDSLSSGINKTFDSNRYIITQNNWNKNLSLIDKIVIENMMKKEINNYGYVKHYQNSFWYIITPILIYFPTKYDKLYFIRIF